MVEVELILRDGFWIDHLANSRWAYIRGMFSVSGPNNSELICTHFTIPEAFIIFS